jgi:hypothetical protein
MSYRLLLLMRRTNFTGILLFALVFTSPVTVYSQGLVITDCQGITRAIHQTRATELNKVQIQVTESGGVPSNGASVQLTDNISGQVYTTQTNSGMAVFNGVPVGNYSMVVSGSNLTVGTVTIGSTGLGVVAASGVVAGGVVAGGGAIAGGVVAVDEINTQISGNSNSGPTPTPQPTTIPTPNPTAIPSTPPEATPTPCDCAPDAEPTPLDNFFDDKEEIKSRSQVALSPYR